MANLNAFLGYFVSYLILFAAFVALAAAACLIGIKWRKSKDDKTALEPSSDISSADEA